MKSPVPPRGPAPDQLSPSAPDVAIAQARNALADAETEVARVSRGRLAQLLGQRIQQRFQYFDDPDLRPADRVLLRASVIESSPGRRNPWASLALVTESIVNRGFRRPRATLAVMALCIGAPAALYGMASHNGDHATVTRITHVTVKDGNGSLVTGVLGPGVDIIVFGEGPTLQAREWIAGSGYATFAVDARDVRVEHRSPWRALTAFATAVHAGWSQAVAPS